MKFILGKKLDMTQVWRGDEVITATRVQAGPCIVTQIKDEKKDGYFAVQVGYGKKKEKNIKKPQKGHLKKLKTQNSKLKTDIKFLREFRCNDAEVKLGDIIDVRAFEPGDIIEVTGISKGKGFQGVVKRYGFHGQDKSHGTKDQLRMPGSIGATGPAHVFKGTRMPGRMGGDRVTVQNLEIIEVDKENNILLIKGAVPGARNGLVEIRGEGELKVAPQQKTENKEQAEIKKT
jgi:large subunit ribosomal protein L3